MAFGLPRDDRLVGNRLVGVAGKDYLESASALGEVKPRPAVVSLAFDLEHQSEIAPVDVQPVAIADALAMAVGEQHALHKITARSKVIFPADLRPEPQSTRIPAVSFHVIACRRGGESPRKKAVDIVAVYVFEKVRSVTPS